MKSRSSFLKEGLKSPAVIISEIFDHLPITIRVITGIGHKVGENTAGNRIGAAWVTHDQEGHGAARFTGEPVNVIVKISREAGQRTANKSLAKNSKCVIHESLVPRRLII